MGLSISSRSGAFSARSRRCKSVRSLGCGFVAQRPTGRLNAWRTREASSLGAHDREPRAGRSKKGLTWHTIRHEFISRTVENTGDPAVAQELARQKDLRTTQGYSHARRARVWSAAVRLNRK